MKPGSIWKSEPDIFPLFPALIFALFSVLILWLINLKRQAQGQFAQILVDARHRLQQDFGRPVDGADLPRLNWHYTNLLVRGHGSRTRYSTRVQ
jgi:hypothetical protein